MSVDHAVELLELDCFTVTISAKTRLLTTTIKQTTQNAGENYSGSVACYESWPGNEVGVFYNASEPTLGQKITPLKKLEQKTSDSAF